MLCLHGYRQNGQIFREKLGQFRKQFKTIEFHFVDAPHVISEDAAENKGNKINPVRIDFINISYPVWSHRQINEAGGSPMKTTLSERSIGLIYV